MKTIEVAIRFTAYVSDEIAEKINLSSEQFYADLPLTQVRLMHDGPLEAKFVEFETMNVEVLGD